MHYIYTVSNGTNSHKTSKRNADIYSKSIRFFALCLIMVLGFTFGFIVNAYAKTESADIMTPERSFSINSDAAYIKHVVEPGESLWSIARLHLPDGDDVQAYIYEIKKFNELASSGLYAGDVLKLPIREQ